MAARLLLLGLVVVGAVVAVHALRADHRCAQVKSAAAHGPLSQPAAIARARPSAAATRATARWSRWCSWPTGSGVPRSTSRAG